MPAKTVRVPYLIACNSVTPDGLFDPSGISISTTEWWVLRKMFRVGVNGELCWKQSQKRRSDQVKKCLSKVCLESRLFNLRPELTDEWGWRWLKPPLKEYVQSASGHEMVCLFRAALSMGKRGSHRFHYEWRGSGKITCRQRFPNSPASLGPYGPKPAVHHGRRDCPPPRGGGREPGP